MRRLQRPALIAAFASLTTLQLKSCVAGAEISLAEEIGFAARAYCTAPTEFRTYLREVFDANAAPNKIRVECAADAL